MNVEDPDKYIHIDRVLQTFGGILLLIVTGICSWMLTRTIDYGERITRIETATHIEQVSLEKYRSELRADLKEIKDDIKTLTNSMTRITKP